MEILENFEIFYGKLETYFGLVFQGKLLDERETSFGSFVRCGYPRMTSTGDLEIVSDCGRYSR